MVEERCRGCAVRRRRRCLKLPRKFVPADPGQSKQRLALSGRLDYWAGSWSKTTPATCHVVDSTRRSQIKIYSWKAPMAILSKSSTRPIHNEPKPTRILHGPGETRSCQVVRPLRRKASDRRKRDCHRAPSKPCPRNPGRLSRVPTASPHLGASHISDGLVAGKISSTWIIRALAASSTNLNCSVVRVQCDPVIRSHVNEGPSTSIDANTTKARCDRRANKGNKWSALHRCAPGSHHGDCT